MPSDTNRLRSWTRRALYLLAAGSATAVAGTALPNCAYGPGPAPADTGPAACTADNDCVQRHGAGWVCNRTSTPPICRLPPDGSP